MTLLATLRQRVFVMGAAIVGLFLAVILVALVHLRDMHHDSDAMWSHLSAQVQAFQKVHQGASALTAAAQRLLEAESPKGVEEAYGHVLTAVGGLSETLDSLGSQQMGVTLLRLRRQSETMSAEALTLAELRLERFAILDRLAGNAITLSRLLEKGAALDPMLLHTTHDFGQIIGHMRQSINYSAVKDVVVALSYFVRDVIPETRVNLGDPEVARALHAVADTIERYDRQMAAEDSAVTTLRRIGGALAADVGPYLVESTRKLHLSLDDAADEARFGLYQDVAMIAAIFLLAVVVLFLLLHRVVLRRLDVIAMAAMGRPGALPESIAVGGIDEIAVVARTLERLNHQANRVAEVRAEQGRLVQAIDEVHEMVAIFDENDRFVFTNATFRAMNAPVAELCAHGQPMLPWVRALVYSGLVEGVRGREEQFIRDRLDNRKGRAALEFQTADGRWLLLRETGLRSGGSVLTATEVTEIRESRDKVVQTSKLATLGEMAAGLAHELNQPLNVIRMAAANCRDLLASDPVDIDFVQRKMDRIDQQTARAAKIIDHMRVFGRKPVEAPVAIDPCAAVKAAVEMITHKAAADSIAIHMAPLEDTPLVIGQPVLLEQVVLNLLVNAIDAINDSGQEGNGEIRLYGRLDKEHKRLEVVIEDNGRGLPVGKEDRIFEPFFTTKDVGKGTGLGLSVSYGIIQQMQGALRAERLEKGTRFIIALRVAGMQQVPCALVAAPDGAEDAADGAQEVAAANVVPFSATNRH